MSEVVNKSILVVGGGMSGLTAAIEAAETGYEVYIIEKEPYLGGRVARMHQYFPKLCPPNCGLEINFRRIKANPMVNLFTMSNVTKIEGKEGNYTVHINTEPSYINENCTACGECAKVCETEIPNPFNSDMDKIKAAYLPHPFAFPMRYVIAPEIAGSDEGKKCADACKYGAVELDMQPKETKLNVGAIIWATGWTPYDYTKIKYYGSGKYANVISNVMMERIAAPTGPTKGKIVRQSDGKEVKKVAFVQCAGSRDENHLPYCSGVCCLASLKQATYVREAYPDSEVYIFYIDIRARGKFEDFYTKVEKDENIHLIKGKVGMITEDSNTKDLTVQAENQETGEILKLSVDMVVLATGIVPNSDDAKAAADILCDDDGFILPDVEKPGQYGAGCACRPMDVAASVQDATAGALKAIQSTVRR